MALNLEKVNTGVIPDGTGGDTPRAAWDKMNRNVDKLNANAIANGKNRLINGSMLFWQRGISFNVPAGGAMYTADRWVFNTGAGANVIVSRVSLALGEVDQFPLAMAVAVNAIGGGVNMRQPIELVNTLAGKNAKLSFWARGNNAGMSLGTRGTQVFGSGGSTNIALGGGQVLALTTGWVRYTVDFQVPSVVGKTAGANNALQVIFDFNSAGTYFIAGVQFEEGVAASDFDYVPYPDELARCMRYYEKSYDGSIYPGAASAFGRRGEFIGINPRNTANSLSVAYMVPKRQTPSIAVYASENGQANAVSQASGTAVAINSISAVGLTGFQVTYTNGSGQYGGSFHYTADAEF